MLVTRKCLNLSDAHSTQFLGYLSEDGNNDNDNDNVLQKYGSLKLSVMAAAVGVKSWGYERL